LPDFCHDAATVLPARLIQNSGPLRYAVFDGMDAGNKRIHNYPPRWNGTPSQDLLAIRRNHQTGAVCNHSRLIQIT
jgi:hypothetical protein